jgi:hypothetical protein
LTKGHGEWEGAGEEGSWEMLVWLEEGRTARGGGSNVRYRHDHAQREEHEESVEHGGRVGGELDTLLDRSCICDEVFVLELRAHSALQSGQIRVS